jgi:hypothetical protein
MKRYPQRGPLLTASRRMLFSSQSVTVYTVSEGGCPQKLRGEKLPMARQSQMI